MFSISFVKVIQYSSQVFWRIRSLFHQSAERYRFQERQERNGLIIRKDQTFYSCLNQKAWSKIWRPLEQRFSFIFLCLNKIRISSLLFITPFVSVFLKKSEDNFLHANGFAGKDLIRFLKMKRKIRYIMVSDS